MKKKVAQKKEKKPTVAKLQKDLWVECKRIIRGRYGNTCFTCDRKGLEGSNWHTGHFIPNAAGGALLRFHLDNLRPQCYNCNINLGGMGGEFYRRLVKEIGQDKVDELFVLKSQTVKAYDHYSMLLCEYRLIETLQN